MCRWQIILTSVLVACFLSGAASALPVIDGHVEPSEYSHSKSISGELEVHWSLTAEHIYFGLEADTAGWVSLGFEPTRAMKDADMIFCWVDDSGGSFVVDAYSTGNYGPHPPDTELGGSSDVTDYDGSQIEGVTVFEFRRLISTGDEYDEAFPLEGDVNVIWGIGPTDDFEQIHSKRGSTTLRMEIIEVALPVLACLLVILARERS